MTIVRDAGTWTTLNVRAQDHDQAVRKATREARRSGYRVADVAAATRQSTGRVWRVEVLVAPR